MSGQIHPNDVLNILETSEEGLTVGQVAEELGVTVAIAGVELWRLVQKGLVNTHIIEFSFGRWIEFSAKKG